MTKNSYPIPQILNDSKKSVMRKKMQILKT